MKYSRLARIFDGNQLKDQSWRAVVACRKRAFLTQVPNVTCCSVSVSVACRSYHRLPAQQHFGLADVGSPPLGVVLGLREELDLTAAHCVQVRVEFELQRKKERHEAEETL